MWVRMRLADLRVVFHYVGLFVFGIGLAMLVPLLVAVFLGEWAAALDYTLGVGVALCIGALLRFTLPREPRITHSQALVLTALGWIAVSLVAAVPLAFSGNYGSYLDALFDAVSGLTTSGLTVARDLDHMAYSHNMWRHLTHLIGGQGIIVAALSLAVGMRSGAFSLYTAEGRDERILPNVLHTTRFIWFVTAVYVGLGTLALSGAGLWLGMEPVRSVLHAFWMSVAAYDTGGFGPQSMNAMYYHSPLYEVVLVFLMLAGTMNFNLHAQIWRGDRTEIWHNIETRVLALNIGLLSLLAALGMAASSLYPHVPEILRKGVFHVISAHSGTGHQTIYPNQWIGEYGGPALAAVMLAMAAGGAVSSTAGGIKALRLGVIVRSMYHQVRVAVAPRTAHIQTRYHHLGEKVLTPEITATASLVFIMYMVTYISGGLIGAAYGYNAGAAMFESISAAANVGLSTGITGPAMPVGLKYLYIFQMWIGRLEFLAVLVLFTQVVLALKPHRRAGRAAS
ncbi:MAG: TrkH family potassium uptake protein [Coriobacteriia bacterium]|nr:TrkH family potassium uptake protein [Coriobacteriia bacterium]